MAPEQPPPPSVGAVGPPPPNPPMFGADVAGGKRQRQKAGASPGFMSTILGGLLPSSTSNATLLGQ
jgi:hypothetical protein